jgi:hypothetical protein
MLYVPVDGCLPSGIVETVEDVQEHRSSIARVCPVTGNEARIRSNSLTGIGLLKSIPTAPNDKGEDK